MTNLQSRRASSIGLVFPGQGSQSVGMGKALAEAYPDIRSLYDEASSVLGYDIAALCFEGPSERLNLTEYTQPALFVSSMAAFHVCKSLDLAPIAVAGHSLGEYSALVAAGGMTYREAVGIVQKRGRYMAEAVPPGTGLVAALLGLAADVVREVCREASVAGVVAAANFNSPGQVVIAGEKAAVERAIELAKAKGCKKAIPLPVSVPVHTPLMQGAADRLAGELAAIRWSDLKMPLINNAEARPITKAGDIQASLVRQLPSSVLWEDSVKAMAAMGVTTFVEVGPGTVLSGLIKRIVPDAVILNVNDPKSFEATRTAFSA
ncbi:MAG: ACP S-malonyltransferase [Nitrospirota bacterium]|nr:ACP S-malonyltransferase [Nitrospirota bacterium]MDP2383187.1 ACP S-malonyltransferase [Nitrospirota bacterium]MDP3598685.1 ACP S-malonyltransferase [Nitrospirota bacterium]